MWGLNTYLSRRIWGSHGGEYEDGRLLGCSAPCSLGLHRATAQKTAIYVLIGFTSVKQCCVDDSVSKKSATFGSSTFSCPHIFGKEVSSITLRPCLCCDLALIQATRRIYCYWIISLELNIEHSALLALLHQLQKPTSISEPQSMWKMSLSQKVTARSRWIIKEVKSTSAGQEIH
jgi:hypothetical protein